MAGLSCRARLTKAATTSPLARAAIEKAGERSARAATAQVAERQFGEAVADTARWTGAKIDAIRRLHEQACEWIRTQRPKLYSRELVDALFNQPYCRIQNIVEAGIAKRETAARYLRELVDIGMLQEQRMGKEKLLLHPAYLRLLSANDHVLQRYVLPRAEAG